MTAQKEANSFLSINYICEMKNCLLLLTINFFAYSYLFAEINNIDSSVSVPCLSVSYRFQIPGGDMANRFSYNSAIGCGFLYKHKSNWITGASGYFLFSKNVKETNMLDSISTSNGYIIDKFGQYALVNMYERGYSFSVKLGKMFSFSKQRPNSGLLLLGGLGFLEHKIRIETLSNTVPQLSEEYKKGYDRLSNGIIVSETIGYLHLGNKRLVNYFAGIELAQAWTKNRRSLNYDTGTKDDKLRNDLFYGFKFAWIIPFYKKMPKEYYYF